MDSILCQVKSAVDSASRPMELLLQKKIPSENRKEKKCIVSPDIEVAILHNANLDLEILLKQKREEAKRLQHTVDEMKTSIQQYEEEKMQLLKKHEKDLESIQCIVSSSNGSSEQEGSVSESNAEKELAVCQEENKRLRDELKRLNESSESFKSAAQTEKNALSSSIQKLEMELNASSSKNTSLITELENARKEVEELKQRVSLTDATTSGESSEVEILKKQLAEETEKVIKSQTTIETLQSEMELERVRTQQASTKLSELEDKLTLTEKELSSARTDSAHFLEDIQAIKQQSSSLKQQVVESERTNKQLKEQVSQLMISVKTMECEKTKAESLEQVMKQRVTLLETQLNKETKEEEKVPENTIHLTERIQRLEEEKKQFEQQVMVYEKEVLEKEKEVSRVKTQLSQLKEKELNCTRYEEQSKRMSQEIDALHIQLQKLESKNNEEKLKLEKRAQFAEQSLEAYKQEMEGSLKEKLRLDCEMKEMKERMEILQKTYDINVSDLNETRKLISTYEESITKLQTLEATKDDSLLENVKEIAELKASVAKERSARDSLSQTLAEESARLQTQYENLLEENNRLRQALEAKHVEDETTLGLLRDSEAKIDRWREGFENSYQQKRVLKEAMKQVLEESTQLKEKVHHEKAVRRALERDLMMREDRESAMQNKKQEEGFETEFSSFEWGRRLSRFIARNPMRWNEYTENVPPMPEEVAIPVIQNTIESLEWSEAEKNYLFNWIDFFAHGGMLENENRFARSLEIQGLTYDILDGFLTLMIPYLKSGIRSGYVVNAFIKQKPSVICDLEVAVTPESQNVTGDTVHSDSAKVVIHKVL